MQFEHIFTLCDNFLKRHHVNLTLAFDSSKITHAERTLYKRQHTTELDDELANQESSKFILYSTPISLSGPIQSVLLSTFQFISGSWSTTIDQHSTDKTTANTTEAIKNLPVFQSQCPSLDYLSRSTFCLYQR